MKILLRGQLIGTFGKTLQNQRRKWINLSGIFQKMGLYIPGPVFKWTKQVRLFKMSI